MPVACSFCDLCVCTWLAGCVCTHTHTFFLAALTKSTYCLQCGGEKDVSVSAKNRRPVYKFTPGVSDSDLVSSVYFDNEKLDLYYGRLKKFQASQDPWKMHAMGVRVSVVVAQRLTCCYWLFRVRSALPVDIRLEACACSPRGLDCDPLLAPV